MAAVNQAEGEAYPGAEKFIPQGRVSLTVLRGAVDGCRGCPLYKHATQGVFGEGPAKAKLMLVGEQPGDQEDLQGKPFVGPAGTLLRKAMAEAKLEPAGAYFTNVVKHFKWSLSNRMRRQHRTPNPKEIRACKPWLEKELGLVKPQLLVLLGATAGQALMGNTFRVTKERGKVITGSSWAPGVVATVHPSSILRAPSDEERRMAYQLFVKDLKVVAKALAS